MSRPVYMVIAIVLLQAATASAAAPLLVYHEAEEVVVIQNVTFRYQAAQKGFVSPRGDWIGWDSRAGNWLLLPKSGGQARFDSAGQMIQMQRAEAPRPEPPGYNPADDLGDSAAKGKFDATKAWEYLGDRQKTVEESIEAGSGDDGGPAVQADAVGGDSRAREKAMREEWAVRPGAHAGDAEAAMETGAVEDPIKKLMDTVGQIRDAVDGVATTVEEADALKRQLDDPGDYIGDRDDDDTGMPDDDQGVIEDDFGADAAQGGSPPSGGSMSPMTRSSLPPQLAGKPPLAAPDNSGAATPTRYGPAGAVGSATGAGNVPDIKNLGTTDDTE